MHRIYIYLIALLLTSHMALGQTVYFEAGQKIIAPGSQVTVPISVKSFSQVVGATFSLSWDTTVIQLLSAHTRSLTGTIAHPDNRTDLFTYLWLDDNLSGESLLDGSSLIELTFEAVGSPGDHSPLAFEGEPTYKEVALTSTQGIFSATDGLIRIDIPQPVEITLFDAHEMDAGIVEVMWEVQQMDEEAWFEVERSAAGGNFHRISALSGKQHQENGLYTFMDHMVPMGKVAYRLRQTDLNGQALYSSIVELEMHKDKAFLVNYPNPAKGKTILRYFLPQDQPKLLLRIYDAQGREVMQLLPSSKQYAGMHEWPIDLSALRPGVYYCHLSGWPVEMKCIVMLR